MQHLINNHQFVCKPGKPGVNNLEIIIFQYNFTFIRMFANIAKRGLSTAAQAPKATSITPPIALFGIHGRYASALYVAAAKVCYDFAFPYSLSHLSCIQANALTKVDEELTAFTEAIRKNSSFGKFLANPTVPRAEKVQQVSGLLEESKVSHVTRNFFLTLAANGKIGESTQVCYVTCVLYTILLIMV